MSLSNDVSRSSSSESLIRRQEVEVEDVNFELILFAAARFRFVSVVLGEKMRVRERCRPPKGVVDSGMGREEAL